MGDKYSYKGIPEVLVIADVDGSDDAGNVYLVVFACDATNHTFRLPAIPPPGAGQRGRAYHIMFVKTTGGTATVIPTGADTVGGAASIALSVGDGIILESDGATNWVIMGRTSGAVYTLPASTSSALGGVKISGTPASAASPTVPVLETGGTIVSTLVDGEAVVNQAAASAQIAAIADTEIDNSAASQVAGGIRAGSVTITTPDTTATVVFGSARGDANYRVCLQQAGGSIVAVTARVLNKIAAGFDIELSAGLTVTYDYIAIPNQ